MSFSQPSLPRRQRGGVLIGVLAFAIIIALTLAGAALLTVSHLTRAATESDAASALNIAEAGVNDELNRMFVNHAADAPADNGPNQPPGAATDFPVSADVGGRYYIYATTIDGKPWTYPNAAYVYSTGVINPGSTSGRDIRRTVRIESELTGAFYTAYGTNTVEFDDAGAKVNGVLGTDGKLTITGHPSISQINFNGSNAGWADQTDDNYNIVHGSDPANWKTSYDFAQQNVGKPSSDKDFSYYATNNDNSTPGMITVNGKNVQMAPGTLSGDGTDHIVLHGKSGGAANYYFGSINLSGASYVSIDNSQGPVNIWVNPTGSFGTIFHGGDAVVPMSQDASKAVKMFMARAGNLVIGSAQSELGGPGTGNSSGPNHIDMGIYNISKSKDGKHQLGGVDVIGPTDFRGQVVCADLTVGANATLTGQRGYFEPQDYFGFGGGYLEIKGGH